MAEIKRTRRKIPQLSWVIFWKGEDRVFVIIKEPLLKKSVVVISAKARMTT
jgi:hypothetical protein